MRSIPHKGLLHPEYFHDYHLWLYERDTSQPWQLTGDGVMQTLLVPVPEPDDDDDLTVSLTVKKLEAGTNQPIPGVTFTVENAVNASLFSVTKTTGPDGTFTLTSETDELAAGQYRITETAAPEGYQAQTESQLVTVMPGSTASSTVTFYNAREGETAGEITGEGTIRKVDADNPTVGIPGAVIRITSVKLDDGGSFTGTYTTGEGGYISKEDLDFASLPFGSYVAEEITPPEGYILSSDVSKVVQHQVNSGRDIVIGGVAGDAAIGAVDDGMGANIVPVGDPGASQNYCREWRMLRTPLSGRSHRWVGGYSPSYDCDHSIDESL